MCRLEEFCIKTHRVKFRSRLPISVPGAFCRAKHDIDSCMNTMSGFERLSYTLYQ